MGEEEGVSNISINFIPQVSLFLLRWIIVVPQSIKAFEESKGAEIYCDFILANWNSIRLHMLKPLIPKWTPISKAFWTIMIGEAKKCLLPSKVPDFIQVLRDLHIKLTLFTNFNPLICKKYSSARRNKRGWYK